MLAALRTWRDILTRRLRDEHATPQTAIFAERQTSRVTLAGGALGRTPFPDCRPANTDNRIFVVGAPVCNAQALTPFENLCIMEPLQQDR